MHPKDKIKFTKLKKKIVTLVESNKETQRANKQDGFVFLIAHLNNELLK